MSGKRPHRYFRADGLHGFDVVCIDNGHIPAAFDPCLIRKGRKVINGAGILFEHTVDGDMVVSSHLHGAPLIEQAAFCAILAKMLQKSGDRILRHPDTGVVFADKGAVIF